MQKLTFINAAGDSAVFDLSPPYIFWKAEGLSLQRAAPVASRASGQNGYTLHGVTLDERTIRLTGHVHGKSGKEELFAQRRRLNAVINPSLGLGQLIYENDAGLWRIPAYAREMPYAAKTGSVQTLTVEFECPSPFWREGDGRELLLSYVDGGLEFPVELPNVFGTMGYAAEVFVDTDVPAPVEITISGGAKNPVVALEGGEFIRVEREIPAWEELYVNTDGEKSEVRIISREGGGVKIENAYGWLSLDSTLFSLAPGRNELEFTSDDDTLKTRVKITYRGLFVGV